MKTLILITLLSLSVLMAKSQDKNSDQGKDTTKSVKHSSEWDYVSIFDDTNRIFHYTLCDPMPAFPGGRSGFQAYIRKRIDKSEDYTNGSPVLIASFVIEKDGSLTDVKFLRHSGVQNDPLKPSSSDIKLAKIIKTAPKWTPGIIKGKPVRVAYLIPLALTDSLKLRDDSLKMKP